MFYFRKKVPGTALIKKRCNVSLHDLVSKHEFDFLSGKISPGGQMEISATKASALDLRFPYDWEVRFVFKDGGLVEKSQSDEFGFTAPAVGYEPEFHYSEHATGPTQGVLDKTFFFKFGNPAVYGRFYVRTEGDSLNIYLDYVLNPAPEDHNLEYDPQKEIKNTK